MGGSKRKHGDISMAEVDFPQRLDHRRLREMMPSDISTIKANVHHLLRCSKHIVCDLFSPFPHFPSPPCFTPHHLFESRAHRSYRRLQLNLRSLSGFFHVLCNHTAETLSFSIDMSSQLEAEAILKRQVEHLEVKLGAQSAEVQRLQSQAAAWTKERQSSARLVEEYKAKLVRLSQRIEVYKEQYNTLQGKMEKAESLQAQKTLVDSGCYEDCTATPPLLQAAADSVKDAIAMCASDLFSTTKKHSISLQARELGFNDDSRAVPIGAYITKAALQALLCQVLFKGFEDPYFFMDCRSWPPFEKPKKLRQGMFQSYKERRDCKPEEMWGFFAEFQEFVKARVPGLRDWLHNLLFASSLKPDQLNESIVSEFLERPHLLRLFKAVWLLQKLAFAMEPTAQIFRVAQSSSFHEEFMEDLAPVHEFEFDDVYGALTDHTKKVSFMCVPGFTVRHTIIKARVVCLKEC